MGQSRTGLYYDAEARREARRQDKEMIPRRLVYAMFALALSSLAFVSWSVATDRPLVGVPPEETPVAVHNVTIAGEGDASYVVTTDGDVLLDAANGAFVAVVRNGLDAQRRKFRIADNPPVTITEYESGRMALFDPATGWQVELSSFGQGNLGHFRRLFAD